MQFDHGMGAFYLFLSLLIILPFQNCSPKKFSSQNGTSSIYQSGEEYAPNLCYKYADEYSGGPCSALPQTKLTTRLDSNGNLVIRVLFPRNFVDNTYGKNAMGWGTKGHTFKDLVGSDHVIVTLYDKSEHVSLVAKLDYISPDPADPTQYKTLGVDGGEGKLLAGNRADVIGVQTSLGVNFNELGYKLVEDSPATDANYTSNASYPKWIFEVWYEVTIKPSAFSAGGGYGRASLDGIHASPSKIGQNTCAVTSATCE